MESKFFRLLLISAAMMLMLPLAFADSKNRQLPHRRRRRPRHG